MHYKYCPLCGGLLERKSISLLNCSECGYRFYQTSNPTVNAIITRTRGAGKQVLLTKRAQEPFKDCWDLPGGFLNNGEDPSCGLSREIAEELGLKLSRLTLFSTFVERYPRPDIPEEAQFTLCLFYLAEIEQTLEPAGLEAHDDIIEAKWFDLEHLPENLSFKGNREVLKKLTAVK